MWGKSDPKDLRQTWADALSWFTGDDIREALLSASSHYPERPPNLPQFRELCNDARRRRIGYQPKLAKPVVKGDIAPDVKAAIDAKAMGAKRGDGRDWARQILADETGKLYPHISYVFAREALGIKPEPLAA